MALTETPLLDTELGIKTNRRHDDSKALPIPAIQQAINYMQYGTVERVVLEMLFLTGCRITEINNMHTHTLFKGPEGYYIKWWCGKNQHAQRAAPLPTTYIKELQHYRNTHKVPRSKIFSTTSQSFNRQFNKHIRPKLGKEWNEKVNVSIKPGNSHLFSQVFNYQLNGCRKTWATLYYYKQLKQTGSMSMALELTSKSMCHKTPRMTAYHYIQNFKHLDIQKYGSFEPAQLLTGQTSLIVTKNFWPESHHHKSETRPAHSLTPRKRQHSLIAWEAQI